MKKWMLVTAIMVLNLAWAMPVLAADSLFGSSAHSGESSTLPCQSHSDLADSSHGDSSSSGSPAKGNSDQG